jgi:hypothetical protein
LDLIFVKKNFTAPVSYSYFGKRQFQYLSTAYMEKLGDLARREQRFDHALLAPRLYE